MKSTLETEYIRRMRSSPARRDPSSLGMSIKLRGRIFASYLGATGLGGNRPRLKKKEPVSGTKKELVIIARPAVTIEQVKADERKKKLLLVLKAMEDQGGVYERSLAYLMYWLKTEKGLNIDYDFFLVGDTPTSKQLREDLVALLYVGLAETDPKTKKIRLTSDGKEFLEKVGYDKDFYEKIAAAIEEYKPKLVTIEAQIELTTMLMKPGAPRRRRKLF